MSTSGKVLLIAGSATDLEVVERCTRVLEELGISYELRIASAHRTPEKVEELAKSAKERGFGLIICFAGLAAHLAGVVSSMTDLPVFSVPVASGPLAGVDALLSSVQMPPGVPVGCLGLGSSGAANAAVLAARILSLSDPDLSLRLESWRERMKEKVEHADERHRKTYIV